ncbi:flagellar motor protein MotB [Paenibacillus sp. JX-17]|uniref:Flagellar motor protein MotB n=1 Tax=Paenibacillus lacisoli TaxID=3064525 RepID=A0ABT9CHD1_9BACL|nr:flagellar motor protein MotB [Paenibacillus sp. JX-17]MDO7908688.1 flagellar motor protein MotB [Paenibacillus sp. JX-17]
MSKKTRHEPHEEHADESWLLPYSDLMTLLLALFITLFSMSSLDAKQFEEMAKSVSAAFNGGSGVLDYKSANPTEATADLGKNKEEIVPTKTKNPDAAVKSQTNTQKLAQQEEEDLQKLKQKLDQYIKQHGLTNQLNTKLNQSQLLITISDNALFASGQAEVKPDARILAKAISSMLTQFSGYDVIVSGHTDNMPIENSRYASNWELSSDRANHFMKILLLNNQLNPSKFSTIGYGEYRPITTNDTPAGRAQNRRVEVSIVRKYQNGTQVISATSRNN